MAKPPKPKNCPVVAVLNMKGGVGKTTISAHVFRHLYFHLKKRALLLDFDPQFNLTQAVVPQNKYDALKAAGRTICSVMEDNKPPTIFQVKSNLGPPPKLADVVHRLKYSGKANPDLDLLLVPGDFDMVKYTLISDPKILKPVKNRFIQFVKDASEQRDVICIDCNPSSSFMTMCALEVATHVLVPVRPDRYSILGLDMLDKFIEAMPGLVKKPELIIMLNGVKTTGYNPEVENQLRGHKKFGPSTMANSLHVSKVLEATVDYTGFATDRSQSWRVTPRLTSIVNELGNILGLT